MRLTKMNGKISSTGAAICEQVFLQDEVQKINILLTSHHQIKYILGEN